MNFMNFILLQFVVMLIEIKSAVLCHSILNICCFSFHLLKLIVAILSISLILNCENTRSAFSRLYCHRV